MVQLVVLYPQPTNVAEFDAAYVTHVALLHEKTGIPTSEKPYTVTKFNSSADNLSAYYQMFMMPFESQEALDATLASSGMQEVAADAGRISTGGAPIFLFGNSN